MRYFAMIGGEKRGPYELGELAKAGVGPDTYVWCKGMADWQQAADVADICRHFRRTVYDRTHSSHLEGLPPVSPVAENPQLVESDAEEDYPLRYRELIRRSGHQGLPPASNSPDISRPPAPTVFLSLFVMLFCFPITGMVALYFSMQARRKWAESQRSESKGNKDLYDDKEREQLKISAHDYDRQARMWIGISFFLGLIVYAFVGHKFS